MHKGQPRVRRTAGNMMLIVIMIAAVIIVAMLVIFTVHFVFFAQKRIQAESDELALRIARKLNEADRAGFMNNLVMYSREGVFNSHNTYNTIRQNARQLEPLARQLLSEAREGAAQVEQERKLLVQFTVAGIKQDLERNSREMKAAVSLPWASYSPPQVETLQLGYIKDVESNVSSPEGNEELLEFDKVQGNLTPNNFYKANKNFSLPEDSDLVFKLSPLPPPVQNTISPPRLASPLAFKILGPLMQEGKFVNANIDVLPSAAKLELISTVRVSIGKETCDTSRVWATGAGCGASPPP